MRSSVHCFANQMCFSYFLLPYLVSYLSTWRYYAGLARFPILCFCTKKAGSYCLDSPPHNNQKNTLLILTLDGGFICSSGHISTLIYTNKVETQSLIIMDSWSSDALCRYHFESYNSEEHCCFDDSSTMSELPKPFIVLCHSKSHPRKPAYSHQFNELLRLLVMYLS